MNIIVCEGITEISIAFHLLKDEIKDSFSRGKLQTIKVDPIKMVDDVYFVNLGGVDNLSQVVVLLLKNKNRSSFKKISFILDADNSFSKREQDLQDEIKKIENTLKITDLFTQYFILPNHKDSGMAEDLLLEIASKPDLVNFINNDIFSKLDEHKDSKITKVAKSKFMIYSACMTPLKNTPHSLIQQADEHLDFTHQKIVELKNFINKAI